MATFFDLGHDSRMKEQFTGLIDTNGQPHAGAPLGALLSAHALATPSSPAVTIAGDCRTYAEIEASTNRRAHFLAERHGVTAGDRVAISMPNRAEFLEAIFAVWKLGGIPCPVSHRMAEAEYGAVLDLIGPRCIVGAGTWGVAGGYAFHDVAHDALEAFSAEPLEPLAASPGRIMNSGGSTGKPKLIADPNPSVWGTDKAGRRARARMTVLLPAPFYHSAPFAYATMALAQGSHLVALEQFGPEEWLDAVGRYRPSFVYLVPTMMSRIAKLPEERTAAADLSSIETLLHMAAPCPPQIKRWWIDRIGPEKVLEVYGGTERIGATAIDGAQWLDHPGSVGQASAGFEIVILGEGGEMLPPGQIGDIYFRAASGPGANYSYIGQDARIRGDLDSFGDMGWVDDDGWLYLADRRTDMIVVGGANVYPAEIEAALETLPGVLCAAVIGLPDPDMGNRLHAIIELSPEIDEPVDGASFLAPALATVSRLKHPRTWEFTRQRIRDDAGKIRRFQLRADRRELPITETQAP